MVASSPFWDGVRFTGDCCSCWCGDETEGAGGFWLNWWPANVVIFLPVLSVPIEELNAFTTIPLSLLSTPAADLSTPV